AWHAATSEESGFERTASAGFSSIAISCVVSTSWRSPESSPAGPNRIGSMPSERAASAPATTSSGARSPPRASTAIRAKVLWGRRAERLDLATAIRLAVRAHSVGPLGLVTDRAQAQARCLDLVLRAPLVATRLRRLLLGDGHERRSIARVTADEDAHGSVRKASGV